MVLRIAFVLFSISIFSLKAQDSQVNKSILKISDFSVQLGINSLPIQPSSVDNFRKLAPESQLLNANFENYNSSKLLAFSSNSFMSILLGMELKNRKSKEYKSNPKLRLGFNYGSFSTLSGFLNQNERFVYDTLISAQTGHVYYVDSVVNRSLIMDQNTQQLSLDIALLYRTNTENRISLYTGIGLGGGISLNTTTSITYNKRSKSETDLETNSYTTGNSYSEETTFKTESFKNKNPYTVWVYVPIGIDFRIGKYSEILKNVNLFLEMRPALSRTSIPDFAETTSGSIASTAGMRYNF
ncbi:MAG: hypothetical protein WED33_11285 [Bacteroidia bacterium]